MSYCKKCEQAIASFESMVHIGIMEDSADSPREQAEMLAYDKGYTCASKGKDCEDTFIEDHFQVIHVGDKA